MLRASLSRARLAAWSIAPRARPQWQHAQRFYADGKRLDDTSISGPAITVTSHLNPNINAPAVEARTIPSSDIPRPPPAPETTSASSSPTASRIAPVVPPATTPPTGTGTASVAPDPNQAPKSKKRRLRRFLAQLILLSALGYAGGVWYSLVSDNFHDFFTEYVPFGEDVVAYFEEREFRRRFPGRAGEPRLHPQITGENKVTIPGKSGLVPRVSSGPSSDLATRGPHVSAVATESQTQPEKQAPKVASSAPPQGAQGQKQEAARKEKPTESASHKLFPKDDADVVELPKEIIIKETKVTAAKPIQPIDHLSVAQANEPVIQDVVKIVNDIITVINSDVARDGKYDSTLEKAKSDLSKVASDITELKEGLQKSAEDRIRANHVEFETAAKELVQRLDHQMQAQETHWKEEYKTERERLAQSYEQRLQAESEAAHRVYEQKLKNEPLQQSISLQRSFTSSVRDQVEQERDGRLGKLNELSSSVQELERLTAEWNSVLDANLKTQHLNVAVEAVKSALENQIVPKPFITELSVLKEIAADDPVVSAAIASINPVAYQRGVPNSAQLIDRFRRVAEEVRKAALLPEDAGVASHLASLAMSKVLFKKSGLAVGQDVEAVQARTEALLEEGDLDSATREMNALQGWAKVLSKDWLSDARRVLEVKQALDVIATESRLQSLLVD